MQDLLSIPPEVCHPGVKAWVVEMVRQCQPSQVHWCDGSEEENQQLCKELEASGTFIRLNAAKT